MRGLRSAWLCVSLLALACGPSSIPGQDDGGMGDDDIDASTDPDARQRPDARIVMPPPPMEVDWPYEDPGADEAAKDDALPDDVRDWFDEPPTTSGAPQLVYPLDGSMHPNNLPNIAFQWTRGSGSSTAFRIEFAADGKKLRYYQGCTSTECEVAIPSNLWLDLGRRLAGKEVTVTVAGGSGRGAPVAMGPAKAIHFSPQPVLGALYYWAAEGRTIKRANLGAGKAVPFIVPASSTNSYDCVACHSVSRNGEVIAFAVTPNEGEDIAAIQTAPTENPEAPFISPPRGTSPFPPDLRGPNTQGPTSNFGHNVALSPDGSIAAINGIPTTTGWPPFFELRNTRTGATLGKWDLGDPIFGGDNLLPIFPEWSPDGTAIAVTLADATGDTETEGCVWTSETCRSSIAVIPVDGNNLGTPRVVVPASGSQYHFYPSWSPDGKWLAFASATYTRGQAQKSESNPAALLRLVRADATRVGCPGTGCLELTRGMRYSPADAAAGRGRQSTWPKFTPFAQGQDGNLMFVSMSSRIDYGFHEQVVGEDGHSQLWLFAIDVSRSGDPSYPPIWLPYQELLDGSLSPYWTTRLPCQADPQGGCSGCVGEEACQVTGDTCFCSAD
jgi:hypothetical protein